MRPRHVIAQFLAESTALGAASGLLGSSLGVLLVLMVATVRHWAAVLQPLAVLPSPLLGVLTGLLAGAYPAYCAARIEPVEALRR